MSEIIIRNFGNRKAYGTLEECKKALLQEFKGKSVTIERINKNGSKRICFVDISQTGIIEDSYPSSQTPSQFEMFEDEYYLEMENADARNRIKAS